MKNISEYIGEIVIKYFKFILQGKKRTEMYAGTRGEYREASKKYG